MKLNHFSTLVTAFAAGFILSGCATGPQEQYFYEQQQARYAPVGVNAAPAYVTVRDGGQSYVVPASQERYYDQQQGYSQGGYYQQRQAPQPRYAYGYDNPRAAQAQAQRSLIGTIGGAAAGNAISHGNSRAIAGGAVVGQMMANHGNPCSEANVGSVIGAAAGYGLGNKIGNGNGRKVASVLGALAGSNVGGDMARQGPRCR